MVDISLPEFPEEAFFALIPDQRSLVDRLLQELVIVNYTLSADRTKLWVIVRALTEEDAIGVIERFPIYDYMRFDVYDLMFHENAFRKTNFLSMN